MMTFYWHVPVSTEEALSSQASTEPVGGLVLPTTVCVCVRVPIFVCSCALLARASVSQRPKQQPYLGTLYFDISFRRKVL